MTTQKYIVPLLFTFMFLIMGSGSAWAQSCSTAGAVQRDGGQILICDGSDWQLATEIENTGRQHVQIAHDTDPCDAAKTGRLRYDAGTGVWEYCDGTGPSWKAFKQPRCTDDFAGGCFLDPDRSDSDPDFIAENIRCDVNILGVTGTGGNKTPAAFSYTAQTDVETSTLITSNTETITGLDCPVAVTIAGDGSPEFSINGDGWATSGTVENNDTLQLRLTSSASYEITHTATVTVGTESEDWSVTTEAEVTCDTTPTEYTAPGTHTYTVPVGCTSVTIEAYGAGGGGAKDSLGGGGGGGSVVERTDTTLLAVGGGGGGGGASVSGGSAGGGGGYGESTVSVSGGSEYLNVWVGGGGHSGCDSIGGDGGDVNGGAGSVTSNGGNSIYGGGGGNNTARGGDSTYGGGGGTNNDQRGGNSDYGGGGGAYNIGAGTSTYGNDGENMSGTGGGGGGGGHGDTTSTGSNGGTSSGGTAANSGPGNGANNNTCGSQGGDGKVVITPSA